MDRHELDELLLVLFHPVLNPPVSKGFKYFFHPTIKLKIIQLVL